MPKLVKNEFTEDLQNHKLTFSDTFMPRNSVYENKLRSRSAT